jgi:hypothetical protein
MSPCGRGNERAGHHLTVGHRDDYFDSRWARAELTDRRWEAKHQNSRMPL